MILSIFYDLLVFHFEQYIDLTLSFSTSILKAIVNLCINILPSF